MRLLFQDQFVARKLWESLYGALFLLYSKSVNLGMYQKAANHKRLVQQRGATFVSRLFLPYPFYFTSGWVKLVFCAHLAPVCALAFLCVFVHILIPAGTLCRA